MEELMYEVWGLDLTLPSDFDGHFLEDCETYSEAIRAKKDYQEQGMAAWIVNKETHELLQA
jgi:hypothetical protein